MVDFSKTRTILSLAESEKALRAESGFGKGEQRWWMAHHQVKIAAFCQRLPKDGVRASPFAVENTC
jgi:hypothetical protein